MPEGVKRNRFHPDDRVRATLSTCGRGACTYLQQIRGQCPPARLGPRGTIYDRSALPRFSGRATPDEVLGVQCRVAALADLFQGKLWAAADPERRPTKRAKDELDLLRIADTYPKYLPLLPPALRARL
jgi:hypothetical protein